MGLTAILTPALTSNSYSAPGAGMISLKNGIEFYRRKDYSSCQHVFTFLLKQDPRKALYWFNLGNCQFMLKDTMGAIRSYEYVIRLRSPLEPAAQLYRAKAYRAAGQWKKARLILAEQSQTLEHPGILVQMEKELDEIENEVRQRALFYYKSEQYADSLKILNQLEPDDSEETKILKGVLLMKLGRRAEARKVLSPLSSNPDDPALSENVQILLKKMESEMPATRGYWLLGDQAFGFNNNVYQDGDDYTHARKLMMRTILGGGRQMYTDGYFSVTPGYTLRFDKHVGASVMDELKHYLSVPMDYHHVSLNTRIAPFYEYLMWGGKSAYWRTGVKLNLEKDFEIVEGGAEIELSKRGYVKLDYAYLDGLVMHYRIYAGKTVYPQYWMGYLEYGVEQSEDLVYPDVGLIPVANSWFTLGVKNVARLDPRWSLFSELSYTWRGFDVQAQPGNKERSDGTLSLSGKAQYLLMNYLFGYLSLDILSNSSTMDKNTLVNKNFSQFILLSGITFEIN